MCKHGTFVVDLVGNFIPMILGNTIQKGRGLKIITAVCSNCGSVMIFNSEKPKN